jgi:hypothetical protein
VTVAIRHSWQRFWPAGSAWALWALAIVGLAVVAWLDDLLRQAGRPDLVALKLTNFPPLFGAVSVATAGAVLASRRPRHPAGWLLLVLGLSLSAAAVAMEYVNYGVARAGAAPAAARVALWLPATIVVAMVSNGFVLLVTPTGALPSPRWRWWASVTAATPVVLLMVVTLASRPGDRPVQAVESPLDLKALDGVQQVAYQAAFAIAAITFVVAAGSLVVRFRRARGIERQQLEWVALATIVVTLLTVIVGVALVLGAFSLAPLAGGLCPPILSLGIGAAVLRYRLYDVDRIISRTLAYALLTLLLGGGYAVLVLLLGLLLGRSSSLAVAGATLAVAAAFRPARRRVQELVDRRFDRRRYDAAQTIAAFSARLREQVDLDTLTRELLGVVDQTMQPTRVELWLRPSHLAPGERGGPQG